MSSSENLTFNILLLAQPRSYLKRLDRSAQKRIANAIELISTNPLGGPNIKPLRGFTQKYRYRVGDIRIVYSVIIEERSIIIETIGSRGDVYKK